MTSSFETACLRYTITHPEPGRVEQSLSVFPDGRRELFVTAALAPEMRNQAGVFSAAPDEATGRRAQETAGRLAALDFEGKPYPRGVQWSVTAQDGGASRSHLLSVTDQTPLPPVLQEALEVGQRWTGQVAAWPYRTAAIHARLQETTRGLRLSVFFDSIGLQPVSILLMDSGLALDAVTQDGARQEIWRLTGRPALGMLYPDGSLADGVNIPAELPAGGQALLALHPELPETAGAGAERMLVLRCRAWIDAAPYGEPARSFTDVPVWLACPVDIG